MSDLFGNPNCWFSDAAAILNTNNRELCYDPALLLNYNNQITGAIHELARGHRMKKMDGRDVKLNDLHFDMPRSQKKK